MAGKATAEDIFIWEGANNKGAKVKGETNGRSVALVKADLRRQGINPIKVRKKPKSLFGSSGVKGKKVTPGDIAIFSRQLATMMSAGVPLVQAFEIAGRGHENPKVQDLLLSVKNDIESGNTLAESLAKHPYYFDELYCNLVQAGEHAGILEDMLGKIASYKEKTESIKNKIKKALFYPIAVIVVAFIITAILMIFVIPTFKDMFTSFGADLPAPTLFVMGVSDIFVEYWYLVFGGVFAGIYTFLEAKKRSVKFQHILQRMSLKMPVFGSLFHKAAIARFARTLSTMFAAGVPLVEALQSVAGAAGNIVYSTAILRMRDDVSTGQQLNITMRQQNLFPNMVVQMTAIGEEAGSIDAMLGKVADFYEAEVDDMVDAISSLMEPFIMVVLGGLIGGMVIAMYLPIFKLGQVV
ncbi:type II secretion system F family protein [Sulfuriflexus mobilis]|uniref:type II secretion system F family protein n=1 Tax=Sulfuriflexus mobilis TaxID=1811807 RepID=UPI000F84DDE8|nr:type II secretion system F family protein [Sulfuriflexus mobilis]